MNKEIINYEEIKDAHLDTLIRLAYKQAELDEIQKLVDENGKDLPDELEFVRIKAYMSFRRKRKQRKRKERRSTCTARLKGRVMWMINIAAVCVLVVGIVGPFAVANVDFLRDKIMDMLIKIEEDHTDISLGPDGEGAVEVPGEWAGMYYPTYIPEGYWLEKGSAFFSLVAFKNEQGKEITFREYTTNAYSNIDSEEAEAIALTINGDEGYIIEKDNLVIIAWSNGERYFILRANESKEIAVRIAEQVQLVQK